MLGILVSYKVNSAKQGSTLHGVFAGWAYRLALNTSVQWLLGGAAVVCDGED